MSKSISVRIDADQKEQLEIIYKKHGMTVSQAVKLFLHESLNKKSLPFDSGFSAASGDKPGKRCDFCGNSDERLKMLRSPLGTHICEDCALICKILF